ncbi:MAG TPA: DNA repair protein RecO [Blastocatellia bacterium]|jgi:DNA repair protein RecO (recombination protein O)|nr:DNA repair protein RecO [Blastocatellia bacterium]
MALHTTQAFVLRTYSLAEADKICVFLTKDQGKVRGVAYGARKLKSRFGSALEPLTQVALTYYQKEGRELVSVSSCEIVQSHFNRAAREFETAGAFSYIAELLMEFLPEHEPNERLYRLVAATLEVIEGQPDSTLMLRYFESWLLRLGGFYPDTSHCAECDGEIDSREPAFLTAEGSPRCLACSGGRGTPADGSLRATIGEMFRVHPSAFARTNVPADQVRRIGEINYQIIRSALERDLRSRNLLRQIGAG